MVALPTPLSPRRTSLIGIDLGQFRSVTCVKDSETTGASFTTLPTDPEVSSKAHDRHRPDLATSTASWS
jgi:hypothetical protein